MTEKIQHELLGAATVANECRADIRAMFSDVQPGGGRIEACLQANLTGLSAPCLDVMARTVGRGSEVCSSSAPWGPHSWLRMTKGMPLVWPEKAAGGGLRGT